jgi:hypothetical protein
MAEEKLYLEDFWGIPEGWTGVSTAPECIELLRDGGWERISLDYDLDFPDRDIAETGTGMDVLEWIAARVSSEPSYRPPRILIHSTNIPARTRMLALLADIEAELERTGRARPPDDPWRDLPS